MLVRCGRRRGRVAALSPGPTRASSPGTAVNHQFFSGAARAGKMTEFEGAPQFGKYGLAPDLKDRQ